MKKPKKIEISTSTTPFPAPAVVISAGEGDNANLITLAWVGRLVSEPPTVAIGVRPSRHSYKLIEDLQEFAINIPFDNRVYDMDYCGMTTGKKTDKWKDLNLTKMAAKHIRVPLVEEFPINIECKVVKKVEIGSHTIFFGEVLAVHVEETLLEDKKLMAQILRPIVFIDHKYLSLSGNLIGKMGLSNEKK